MKKLLIVTAYWPPRIHVATNRVFAFAKYFNEDGYEVTVLTGAQNGGGDALALTTESGINVIRIPARHFLNRSTFEKRSSPIIHKLKALKNKVLNQIVVDDTPGLFINYLRLKDQLPLEQFDLMLSSYAPLSVHRIGLDIKKSFPKIKWVADFRDEMSFLPGLPKIIKSKLATFENQIINECDIVTSVSEPLLSQFKTFSKKPKYLEIRNGFDFEIDEQPDFSSKDVFKILYTGTFHGAMNPQIFFTAMELFTAKYPIQKIQIDFYCGTIPMAIPEKLKPFVNLHEKVSYSQIPEILKKASVFLLIQAPSSRQGVFSGKTFDYLAINRPIFAIIPYDDVAADLIRETRSGFVCPVSAETTAEFVFPVLEKLYTAWLKDELPARDWSLIKTQSRKMQISCLLSALKAELNS